MGKRRFILGTYLLAAYLCFVLSASCFIHTHRFEWGTVTHSHPFPMGGHTHSQASCQLISYLDLAVSEPASEPFAAELPSCLAESCDTPEPHDAGCGMPHRTLRAPPATAHATVYA